MARRLYPTLPLGLGESAPSFVSRLARINRVGSARVLCTEMGLSFQGIVDGAPNALRDLADLSGASYAALTQQTLRRDGDVWYIRGERVLKTSLRRKRLFVCTSCLRDDDIAASDLPADIAVFGRTSWFLAHLRTCPIHDVALVEAAAIEKAAEAHDFGALVGAKAEILVQDIENAISRKPSAFEAYLLDRLENGAKGELWLDSLEFSPAARLCEMVGAVATRGRRPAPTKMTDDEWWAAGDAGFKVAIGGVDAFRAFLSELTRSFPYNRANVGPQAEYGLLHQWLTFSALDAAHDPIRDVMYRHICETTPVAPGDLVMGKPVNDRRVHSIRTAAVELGVHPVRLRKILAAKGVIAENQMDDPDDRIVFDAAHVREIAESGVVDGIPLRDVVTYLNTTRVHARLLAESGMIIPAPGSDAPGSNAVFAKDDLDDFMTRLLAGAEVVTEPSENHCAIPKAAKRASCGAMEIVRLILDRKLAWVGRLAGVEGYLSVLIDYLEIRQLTRGAALEGLTAEQIKIEMKTTTRVVNALIAAGHLTTRTVINPLNRCPVKIVAREDLDGFRIEYATLIELAREQGIHQLALKAKLVALAVEPSLDKKIIGATFFRRAEVKKSE